MSSETASGVSFDTLLSAIEAVKAEVEGLTSSLKSAEARIERLEAFTFFTPPESPVVGPQSTKDVQQSAISDELAQKGKANDLGPIEKVIRSSLEEAFKKMDNKSMKQPEETSRTESPSDIQQHLQPINAGITALAKHLERIELSIDLLGKTNTPSPSVTVQTSPQGSPAPEVIPTLAKEAISPKEATEPTIVPKSSLPTPSTLTSSKVRGRNSIAPGSPSIPSELPRLIFGQTTTPAKRRPVSLNVSASPYGSYADEKSPFSQLASQRSGRSSVLSNAERSISPLDIQETPEDCKPRSSTPKLKHKD